MTTVAELDSEIYKESGFEDAEELAGLPGQIAFYQWHGGGWRAGESPHDNPNMVIYRMFGSGSNEERVDHIPYVLGDVRVYAFPKQSLPGEGFRRITLSRSSPVQTTEIMNRDAWIVEISREIAELSAIDANREDCPNEKCDSTVDQDDNFCSSCGTEIPHEDEEEEDEDDDVEDDAAEEGATVTTGPLTGTITGSTPPAAPVG